MDACAVDLFQAAAAAEECEIEPDAQALASEAAAKRDAAANEARLKGMEWLRFNEMFQLTASVQP